MEEKDITIETVQNEDGVQTTTVTEEPFEIQEADQADVISEEESDSDGKLGLAVLGLGAAAIGGLIAVGIKKHKDKKKAKEAEGSEEDPKPAKQKKVKEIKGVTRGRKLTLAERWHGCVLKPVEPEKAETAEDEAN